MPSIFQTSVLAPVAIPPSKVGPAGTHYVLALNVQTQMQTLWCWSAVAVSISGFYASSSAWTQCSLADNQLNQTTCCANGQHCRCNKVWYLDRALTGTGNFNLWQTGIIPANILVRELAAGQPVGCRIQWNGSRDGHFVAIHGYDSNPPYETIDVQDPFYGPSTVDYVTFQTAYSPLSTVGGKWTDTYFTKS